MSEELMTAADQQRLNQLGGEIRALHNQTVMTAIEIGRRLQEAKQIAGHGHWGEWLEKNVGYSQTQATNLMHLYEEYGSGQIGLFGDTLPDNIKGLGVTKAIALLEVPADEREAFVEKVDAESISTRELQAEVKKYKAEAETAKERSDEFQKMTKDAQTFAKEAQKQATELRTQVADLEKQLQELENRPVEVAVEGPSEEMLAQIRADEQAKFDKERENLQKKLKTAEGKLKAAEQEIAEAQAQDAKASEELEKKAQAMAAEANQRADAAEARAEAAEKKLKASDSDSAQLKIYMETVQTYWNKARGLTMKAAPEKKEKFEAFMQMVLRNMEGSLS